MLLPCRIAVFLWSTAFIQQWPGLVLRASTSRYLTAHLAARINAFFLFHVAFAFFGDASSETVLRFGRPPLGETPWASRRIMGRFSRPSQAGCFDALQHKRTNHELVSCVLRSAFQRENRSLWRWIIPLRFQGRLTSL
jgi:hypothetical protein